MAYFLSKQVHRLQKKKEILADTELFRIIYFRVLHNIN